MFCAPAPSPQVLQVLGAGHASLRKIGLVPKGPASESAHLLLQALICWLSMMASDLRQGREEALYIAEVQTRRFATMSRSGTGFCWGFHIAKDP